jgi:hypothetical protein
MFKFVHCAAKVGRNVIASKYKLIFLAADSALVREKEFIASVVANF